jgi:hypothetical protein
MAEDPYRVLGLHRSASAAEVQARYLELAKTRHPDSGDSRASQAAFASIKDARDRALNPRSSSAASAASSSPPRPPPEEGLAQRQARRQRARSTSWFTRADARFHAALIFTLFVGPVMVGDLANRAWSAHNRGCSLADARNAIEASKWRVSSLSLHAERVGSEAPASGDVRQAHAAQEPRR